MTMTLRIREIAANEFVRVWPIFRSVIAGSDTYSHAPESGPRHRLAWQGHAHQDTLSAL